MAVKRFSCNECGSKYATKAKLEEHVKSHKKFPHSKKEHRCEACKEIFKTVVLLKKHRFNCSTLVSDEVPKEKRKRVGRKTPEPANKSNAKNCSNDDNLKEQMFTKVHSLLDGSKAKTVTDSKFTKSGSVFAGCSLSADGIQSMSLSIKNSMDSHGQACEKSAEIVGTGVSDTEKTVADKPKTVKRVTGRLSRKTRSRRNAGHTADSEAPATSGSMNLTENLVSSEPQKSSNEKEQSQVKTNFPRNKSSKGLKQGLKKGNQRKSTSSERSQGEERSELGDPQDVSGPAIETENSEKSPNNNSDTAGPKKTADRKQKQFTCANCAKSFSRKYHLDRHLKLYPCSGLPPPSYPCQLCNRVYTRKDNLREHLRMHTGEGTRKKKHQCTYCNKAFHGLSLLTIHIRKHTGEKPFACDFCPKQFPSAGALSKHRRTHTGEKPFVCPECGYRFSLKGTLNRHLRVHTGVRPHQCLYCGKQFIQIGGLKAHLFYHTGENGFKCDECGKIFNRKARLQMHKLYVHVKLRPYKCSSCSKSFTRKEDLNRHAILHTGKKPYKCPTCSKSFAIKPSLKLHLLTHTKEEPRSCHECGRAFIRKDCLLRHMRKRHRDLLDKILLAEKDEKFGEPSTVNSRMLSEEDLCENIQELLSLLVDESTLVSFGWPLKPVHEVLEAVIRRCGHTPVNPDQYSYMDRMRENAKLLFTVVIDDNAVKTLLNNQTVDEVILHVLRLAKT